MNTSIFSINGKKVGEKEVATGSGFDMIIFHRADGAQGPKDVFIDDVFLYSR